MLTLSAPLTALLPPLAPFHGRSAAARCGATPPPISMLFRPPDSVDLERKLRLQLLQRRIGSRREHERSEPQWTVAAAGLPDKEEEEEEEPFDAKMQYYIELKVQDVLDARLRDALAAASYDEGFEAAPSDALVQPLVQHAACRRQLAGPWTPACGAPPLAGLSFREHSTAWGRYPYPLPLTPYPLPLTPYPLPVPVPVPVTLTPTPTPNRELNQVSSTAWNSVYTAPPRSHAPNCLVCRRSARLSATLPAPLPTSCAAPRGWHAPSHPRILTLTLTLTLTLALTPTPTLTLALTLTLTRPKPEPDH